MALFAGVNRQIVFGLVLAGLAACSSAPRQPAEEVEEIDLSSGSEKTLVVPQQPRGAQRSSAVDALLNDADDAIKAGNYSRAEATIERAIRVAPDDARIYFSLAQVHYFQNQIELGRSFLAKAESLAVNNKPLQDAIAAFKHRLP